ncbi:lytic polysaccharide monooxygenase auxiliary activity family 9 protein [Saccharothrix deserti]|uniref:lytic polysaccharide monooxygenase auxiliary activity family 9 protein n=1 Tax=Saccharothrix deserti TaxID=2593674 RepID=UPI001EE4D886|nr:lytic polysaccharide monooxygenase [Saccharothrix deserti]
MVIFNMVILNEEERVALISIPANKSLLAKVVATLAVVGGLMASVLTGVADAHGSTVDPPSRNYGCWQRWGNDFQNPAMAQQDPMCWQAWQADTTAMWNWNGLYREGVAGNHQGVIPNGQLCSGGRTGGTRYAALDNPGQWKAATKARQFTLDVWDQARHGADYLRVYVSKQGYDATTTPLGWNHLDLVATTGRYAPAEHYQVAVNAGSRTGRHVVYVIWQASHLDQSFYFCSDVIFQ